MFAVKNNILYLDNNYMNFAPVLECPHKKTTDTNPANKQYKICLECKAKVCKHPDKYVIAIEKKLDRYQEEEYKNIFYKAGSNTTFHCELCNCDILSNILWN
jgi:hypothetical protein